jgi:hypothetical protein
MSESAVSTISLLSDQSDAFGADVIEQGEHHFSFKMPVLRADGKTVLYKLVASINGAQVSAMEAADNRRLPSFCPERHINSDGSFCLYWSGDQNLEVVDAASATAWWETLHEFLKIQERAENKRKWPVEIGWAHGEAAIYQKKAEDAAAKIGTEFLRDFLGKHFHVKRCESSTRRRTFFLRVYNRGRLLYSVIEKTETVACLTQKCFCSRDAERLGDCKDHAIAAADFATSLYRMGIEERKFWNNFPNKSCCGSVDNCPLQGS